MPIYKIRAGERLDEFYAADPRYALDYGSELLAEAETESIRVAAEASAGDGNLPDGAVDHLQEHWLDGVGDVAGEDVDRVLRHGYREAIRIAQQYDPPVPIESFWVTGTGIELGVDINAGPSRVTVFISTPQARNYGSRHAASRSWAIRLGDRAEIRPDAPREQLDGGGTPIVKIQVSGEFESAG